MIENNRPKPVIICLSSLYFFSRACQKECQIFAKGYSVKLCCTQLKLKDHAHLLLKKSLAPHAAIKHQKLLISLQCSNTIYMYSWTQPVLLDKMYVNNDLHVFIYFMQVYSFISLSSVHQYILVRVTVNLGNTEKHPEWEHQFITGHQTHARSQLGAIHHR